MKAKDRRDHDLRRRKPSRLQRRTSLIACEGDKLEPDYLHGLRRALRLEKERVVIVPSGNDTDPRNIIQRALKKAQIEGQSFDFILCVIDRDSHPGFCEAQRMVASHRLGKGGILKLIVSVPCFEVWMLLHLTDYSTAAFPSPDAARAKMKHILPGYTQMGPGLYSKLAPGQPQALAYAQRLKEHHRANGSGGNPSTDMPQVWEILEKLSNEAKWPNP